MAARERVRLRRKLDKGLKRDVPGGAHVGERIGQQPGGSKLQRVKDRGDRLGPRRNGSQINKGSGRQRVAVGVVVAEREIQFERVLEGRQFATGTEGEVEEAVQPGREQIGQLRFNERQLDVPGKNSAGSGWVAVVAQDGSHLNREVAEDLALELFNLLGDLRLGSQGVDHAEQFPLNGVLNHLLGIEQIFKRLSNQRQ